jgi:hypothetical protein
MRRRIVFKLPGRSARARLKRSVARSASEEALSAKPFISRDLSTGAEKLICAPYQQQVVGVLKDWIEVLRASVAPALIMLRQLRIEQEKVVAVVVVRLGEVEARVSDPLKLGGHGIAGVVALGLAAAVNLTVTWHFLETFGWPVWVTVLADIALVAVEIAVTALVGRGTASLVLDRPGTAFELEPAERTHVWAMTIAMAVLGVAFVVGLAFARGIVWLLAGLIGAALGVWLGAASYEAKFHIQRDRLERELKKKRDKLGKLTARIQSARDSATGATRWLRDEAERVLNHGDIVFVRAFRKAHHRETAVAVPAIPLPTLPTDEELVELLDLPVTDPEGDGEEEGHDEGVSLFEPHTA